MASGMFRSRPFWLGGTLKRGPGGSTAEALAQPDVDDAAEVVVAVAAGRGAARVARPGVGEGGAAVAPLGDVFQLDAQVQVLARTPFDEGHQVGVLLGRVAGVEAIGDLLVAAIG